MYGCSQKLDREITVRHAVETVRRRRVKTQCIRSHEAVNRETSARKCRRTKRRTIEPPPRIGKAPPVTRQHFIIGHQVVT